MINKVDDKGELPIFRARSRAGDFIFCGTIGVICLISALFFAHGSVLAGGIIAGGYLIALILRYSLLSDAPAVRAGTNVSEEQLELIERLRALLNALPQPVMLLNDEGSIEMSNRASEEMFGKQSTGRHIAAVIRVPKAHEALRTLEATGKPVETEISLTGAQERTALFYAAGLGISNAHDRGAMIVMLRDRTEQKKLERMRTDFVANASHELRTPLASMAGFIETLQGHAKNDPAARERFLEVMAAQADRMLRLVEDLIGLSAIELNETKPLTDKVDLAALTASVTESLQPIAQAKNSELIVETGDVPAMVLGDRHELFRLFQNLCENALKYGVNEETGRATVTVRVGFGHPPAREGYIRTGDSAPQIAVRAGVEEARLVHVQIADNGEGIEPNDLPRLTERFYRVNPQLSRAKGGTGLGLAIVKHILGRHRGGLQIESQLGEGSTFTVFFPPLQGEQLPRTLSADKDKRTERA
ncbi:ATP-binding protein [Parvularcula marina]|uniref:ATP-binding protein n=1 Tax=Parvularcula marina TaxID=2292771 RepID=UPI0035126FA6